ncbi:MAG: leucyl/phenylalanyl-tRNA--protein transferase [Halobacteriovoraceae bacterium]|nr:leucyl/phenylalanyl-tRNA--protein transferase [Halobacteriovoraceae bacterium]|tara:strand:+ start:12443 stop:13108 length:666 start_codon:yes stop_codon:yes gene_type:complete
MPIKFPPVHSATPEGLLAVGGKIDTETLKSAYTQGIFPWPISKNSPLTWFSPDPRGILELKDFHISRSFNRFLRKNPYTIKFNHNFEEVIRNCAVVKRKHEKGTWISQDIITGYNELFNQGLSYCVAVYHEKRLVGGLYGVCMGELISGESMFHKETNASKLAFYALVHQLESKGIRWIDTQMVTPVIKSFGGTEISRTNFIKKLQALNFEHPQRSQLFGS